MIDFPLRRESNIFSRHCFGDFPVPAHKGVAFSCRVGRCGNYRAVILRNGRNLAAACGVEGYCVLIDFPLRRDSHIFGGHGFGNSPVPTDKGVAFSCRVGRGGDRRTVVLRNRHNLAASVGIKGNRVLIDFPLCRESNIFGGHGFGNFPVPADKGVAFSCRVGRCGNYRAVVLRNRRNLAAACGVEGYCVPIYYPLRIQGAVFRLVIPACAFAIAVTVAFAFNRGIIPAAEKVTGAYWHRHIAELFAV